MLESKLNHEAIEAFAKSFSKEVCDSYFGKKEAISGKEIVELTPVKQVNFFVLKILFRQWQKETLRLQSPYFNYRTEEVRKALLSFMNVLSQQISIRREYFDPLLRLATREALLLIISPYEFFREELTGHESGRLNNKYLKNSDKYIKVNRHIFEAYKNRFEALGEGDMEHEDALALLDDVFMSMETAPEETAVYEAAFNQVVEIDFRTFWPEEAQAEAFVEDKETAAEAGAGESEVLDEIGGGSYTEDEERDDPDDDDEDIDEVHKEAEEDLEDDIEAGALEDEYKTLDEIDEEKATEPEPAGTEDTAPFRFIEKETEEEDIEDSPLNRQYTSGKMPLHEQLKSEKGITLAEVHQSQKIESIIGSISINQKYMFVNELFKGEDEVFVGAMSKVEGCSSFDEAVELLIQAYSKDLGWDMNAPEVKELLKVIFKKFR